jgi:hypothetical protein
MQQQKSPKTCRKSKNFPEKMRIPAVSRSWLEGIFLVSEFFGSARLKNLLKYVGGSGAMWNMAQNETSLYFCMKQVLKLVSCKNRRMFRFAPCST